MDVDAERGPRRQEPDCPIRTVANDEAAPRRDSSDRRAAPNQLHTPNDNRDVRGRRTNDSRAREGDIDIRPPVPGHDVKLTIDADVSNTAKQDVPQAVIAQLGQVGIKVNLTALPTDEKKDPTFCQ